MGTREPRMSLEKRVLSLLTDGKPRTSAEITAEIGLPYRQVRHAIMGVVHSACVESRPVIYTITPIGVLTAARVEAKCRSLEEKKAIHAALRNRHTATRIATAAEYVEKRAAMEEERVKRKAEAEQAKADRIAANNAKSLERRAALLLKAQPKSTVSRESVREAAQRAMRLAENVSLVANAVRNVPNSVFAMGAR